MGGEEEREKGGFSFQLVTYDLSPGYSEILKITETYPCQPLPPPENWLSEILKMVRHPYADLRTKLDPGRTSQITFLVFCL